ncbi:MAG: Endopolyphosphatase [Bogoriella megaspora]|nr:MAG: Endopolyphosphatase [Bogoriella megaspora]
MRTPQLCSALPLLGLAILGYFAETGTSAPSFSLHPEGIGQQVLQEPGSRVFEQTKDGGIVEVEAHATKGRKLTGKFLHITDLHPDPFYKLYSSTASSDACHHGDGPAGYYGAETSDCDSPITLINATFTWIQHHLASSIDFVIWTGDSARHDNDVSIPRNESQVVSQNKFLVEKFREVWGKHNGDEEDEDPTNDFKIPIVPTVGNNDILPHNIFEGGPNHWTKLYASIWRSFVPEEQRHAFEQGGWYYVEVVPDRLAVFSLNTMYFYEKNAAVDGCALDSEPGYEAFEWLRVRLELLRQRGIKAILSGHVPPARTESKRHWDETCWQKYALWLRQYRDVIIAGVWGHMNVEHFMLQDFEDVDWKVLEASPDFDDEAEDIEDERRIALRKRGDNDFSIASTEDYLKDLRSQWSDLPKPPSTLSQKSAIRASISRDSDDARPEWEIDTLASSSNPSLRKKKDEKARKQFLKKIGGKWHERYAISLVSASIVPNFMPTLRVFSYNISGLSSHNTFSATPRPVTSLAKAEAKLQATAQLSNAVSDDSIDIDYEPDSVETEKKKHKKKKGKKRKGKKGRKPDFPIPDPPSKTSVPGPAYSPQSLTLLGYTQYFANLTKLNNDFLDTPSISSDSEPSAEENILEGTSWLEWLPRVLRWKPGKHHGKHPKSRHEKPHPKEFGFEVEYDTRDDGVFGLEDLTVGQWVRLARRIGRKAGKDGSISEDGSEGEGVGGCAEMEMEIDGEGEEVEEGELGGEGVDVEKKKKKKKKGRKGGKKKKKHGKNKVWEMFVKRAFVGTMSVEDIDEIYG